MTEAVRIVDAKDEFFDIIRGPARALLEFEEAVNNLNNATMYSDTLLCQVLAYVKVHGGEDENVVLSPAFTFVVRLAQWRLDIRGGHVPQSSAIEMIKTFEREIDQTPPPAWAVKLKERYGLRFPK